MTNNETQAFILRLVRQKHGELRQATASLLKEMAGDNMDRKKALASQVQRQAQDLRNVLSDKDVPPWLSTAIAYLPTFADGRMSPPDFLDSLIAWKPQCDNHRWVFEEEDESAFDFDAIYERFKGESRLPELFDQVVRTLEEIHASGEVDSVTMLRALGKVISTIKKCKDGSYFSLNGAWEFLLSFLKNYLWGELSNLPVFGTAMTALRKTIEELNDEMFSLHAKIKSEMAKTVETEIKKLDGKSDFRSIAYDKTGRLLPGPAAPLLSDATA